MYVQSFPRVLLLGTWREHVLSFSCCRVQILGIFLKQPVFKQGTGLSPFSSRSLSWDCKQIFLTWVDAMCCYGRMWILLAQGELEMRCWNSRSVMVEDETVFEEILKTDRGDALRTHIPCNSKMKILVLPKAGSGKAPARGLRWKKEWVHKQMKRNFNYTEELDDEIGCKMQQ